MDGPGAPPQPPPPRWGDRGPTPPPASVGCRRDPPPLLLLRCGDVEPHSGPLRVARANVTSLRLHWHTVTEWRVDVVLLSETRLTTVAQQVMRAQAGASEWQALWGGAPLESRGGGGGGAAGMRGGAGNSGAPGHSRETSPPPPRSAPERGGLPRPGPMALHPLVPCPAGPGAGSGFPAFPGGLGRLLPAGPQPGLLGPGHTVRGAPWGGPQRLVAGDFNFDLNHLLRAPPFVLASLLVRRLVDADLELASAFGRDPLCSYQSLEGTRPLRIDGLLVDTRLAALLHAAELLPRGAILGHTPVRFDLHLKGTSQRVVKFIRPKPVELAPREEHERLLLTQRLVDPLETSLQAALSTGDVDRAWAFWTTAAEETLLALACLDITPDSLPAGAALSLAPSHLPRGRGTDQLLREVRLCPKQRRDTGGPLTCPLARMQAAQGPLRNVLRWLERPTRGAGAASSGVRQARTALQCRLDRLRALGPEYTILELGGTHDRLAPLESLRRLRTTLAGKV